RLRRRAEADPEHRPAAFTIQHVHRTAMSTHDLIDDRQSQPRSLRMLPPRRGEPDETLEDPCALAGGDAGSAIADVDLARLRRSSRRDADPASGGGVADGVEDEVREGAGDAAAVAVDAALALDRDALLAGDRAGEGDRVVDRVVDGERLADALRVGVAARELEQIVD